MLFTGGETHKVKNISRPIAVWHWRKDGDEIETGAATLDKNAGSPQPLNTPEIRQVVRYCTSDDGTALAYAIAGEGPPLFKAQHFMTHLEHEWQSPNFRPLYRDLARHYTFIRHDQRGNGLSDRTPAEISFDRFVDDFAAVVEATGIERFPIYALSQGAAVAIAYAAKNPERVSALILQGGYARGRKKRGKLNEDDIAKIEALTTLIRTGWGQDNPAFRHMFTTMFIPGATTEQMDSFDEMMRIATDPVTAAEIFNVNANTDVCDLLPDVKAPTLILHSRLDAVSPFEEGKLLARSIDKAELVELSSPNHILLHDEPDNQRLIAEIDRFLTEHPV